MTSLQQPKLGTDPVKGWPYYALHMTASYVLKEFFLAFNYRECLAASESRTTEIGPWSVSMRREGYHELFTHSFVGMWAAFEAGLEDTLAAFLKNSHRAATAAAARFPVQRYPMSKWPWDQSVCTEIAQKLDQKAKTSLSNGGFDIHARYQLMFGWIEIDLPDDVRLSEELAEVNLLRNIIMHRYGRIDEKDAEQLPKLKHWIGSVMPLDQESFTRYNKAISSLLVVLMNAIAKSPHIEA
jgi:hypothetical protein